MADTVMTRGHVLTILTRRELAGDGPVTKAELQQLVGLGMGDLGVAVGILVDEGKVRELADGTVEKVPEGEAVPSEAADTVAQARAFLEDHGVVTAAMDDGSVLREMLRIKTEEERQQQQGVPDGAGEGPGSPPMLYPRVSDPATEFKLSPTMAAAMTPEALGGVVMAGIAEAEKLGRAFVLVVEA